MSRRERLRRVRPRSLRSRLVWGTALLAVLAVLAAQTIGFLVLRSWLLDRVDQQLSDFFVPNLPAPASLLAPVSPPTDGSVTLPSDFRLTFYDASGHRTASVGSSKKPGPNLPATADALPGGSQPATVNAVSGNGRWRVLVKSRPDDTSYVVALPLDTVDGATNKLLWLNAVVLLLTAVALIAASRWVVRIGLLPLTRMERTAQEVSVSDLSLRVADTDPGTEIGRLGTVLNTMLDRLEQALRGREASEARLRRFVADAGHELRTPLTSVLGFAELRLRHPGLTQAELDETDRLIAQNAERMRLIVDDLLLLAKLDREPEYRSESVDLLALAADAIDAATPDIGTHPIHLAGLDDAAEPTGPVEAVGDPHRLGQVVGNLLANALTHTPPGTPVAVRVGTAHASPTAGGVDTDGRFSGTAPLAEDTRCTVLEVADTGPGLPPETAGRVFERFYRADPSRSRVQGGSGLGLAIASAIAEGHGGRLEVDTAPNQGCVFRLLLPVRD